MKRLSKNNKGVSLVEMIVVVAIISVLAGITSIGLGAAVSKPAEECAEKIVSTLKNARITTMGKRSCEIYLKQASEGAIVTVAENINNSGSVPANDKFLKIGERNITVTLTLSTTAGATTEVKLSDVDYIVLTYNRETGGFKPTFVKSTSGDIDDEYLTKIVVTKGTKTKTINLARLTGKISID